MNHDSAVAQDDIEIASSSLRFRHTNNTELLHHHLRTRDSSADRK